MKHIIPLFYLILSPIAEPCFAQATEILAVNDVHRIEYHWEGTENMEEIRDLFLESFIDNYQRLGLTEQDLGTNDIRAVLNNYWIEELESLEKKTVRWLVAKKEDEIVGYVSFNFEKAPEEVFLQLLCVKPLEQKQGIGTHLVNSVLQIERVCKVSLVTRRSNSSAIAFYKKLGFEKCLSLDKKANIDQHLCVQLEMILERL